MDDGGLERIGARSLCAVVAARLVGTAFCEAGNVLHSAGHSLGEFGKVAWMVESHFGRRYQTVTGVDLAETVGEPGYVYADADDEDDD
jgi:hypothetical protein